LLLLLLMLAVYGSSTLSPPLTFMPQTTHPIITWKQEKCWRSGALKARQIKHHRQLLAGARSPTDRPTCLPTSMVSQLSWGQTNIGRQITHVQCDMTIEVPKMKCYITVKERDPTATLLHSFPHLTLHFSLFHFHFQSCSFFDSQSKKRMGSSYMWHHRN